MVPIQYMINDSLNAGGPSICFTGKFGLNDYDTQCHGNGYENGALLNAQYVVNISTRPTTLKKSVLTSCSSEKP